MRTPNLNSLRMFDVAARHLNFRAAAEHLNITQGAVAQQVRRLEADLGFQLFRRHARGLTLTNIGREYHLPIRRALAMIEEATQKLQPEATRITLSVTPSFAAKWLVSRLGLFAESHPDIDIQTLASEGVSNFRTDGVDIAIRQGRPSFGHGLQQDLLSPLDLCAVCSPTFLKKTSRIRSLKDFAAHQLIQDGHGHWDTLFEDIGIIPTLRITKFNQTALTIDTAANGHGIALAPKILVADDIKAGKLIEIWKDTRDNLGGYYVVRPEQQKSNSSIETVINWILSEVL